MYPTLLARWLPLRSAPIDQSPPSHQNSELDCPNTNTTMQLLHTSPLLLRDSLAIDGGTRTIPH